jgi:hypothetical protein
MKNCKKFLPDRENMNYKDGGEYKTAVLYKIKEQKLCHCLLE